MPMVYTTRSWYKLDKLSGEMVSVDYEDFEFKSEGRQWTSVMGRESVGQPPVRTVRMRNSCSGSKRLRRFAHHQNSTCQCLYGFV